MTAFVPTDGIAATCTAPLMERGLPSRSSIEYRVEPVGPPACSEATVSVTTAGRVLGHVGRRDDRRCLAHHVVERDREARGRARRATRARRERPG